MDEWLEIRVCCCGVLCVSGVVDLKIVFFYFRADDDDVGLTDFSGMALFQKSMQT